MKSQNLAAALCLLSIALSSCEMSPYPDYWDDPSKAPAITGISPSSVSTTGGGETIRISGERVGTTRTVVIGGRNATIRTRTQAFVDIELPPAPPGAGQVDVALVTDDGYTIAEDAFTWAVEGWDWWKDEVASAALYTVECPIVASGYILWCGAEMGYGDAYAYDGVGPQPGFAGNLAGFGELSVLPAPGEIRVFGPGERKLAAAPMLYGSHAEGESLSITTPRDLDRDLDFILERQDMLMEYYPWAKDIRSIQDPVFWTHTDNPDCALEEPPEDTGLPAWEIVENTQVTLGYEDEIGEPTAVELGYTWKESMGLQVATNVTFLGTAGVLYNQGGSLTLAPSGVVLDYNSYSGWFFKQQEPQRVDLADLPGDQDYKVTLRTLEETLELGKVRSAPAISKLSPDLLTGSVMVPRRDGLELTWTPQGDPGADPSYVVIDLRVYDTTIDDPYWLTELWRVTVRGDDNTGRATIPSQVLETLPICENQLDDNYDFTGYWAELSVTRHQLRKVKVDGGDLVIDFVHSVQSPIRLR